MRTQEEQIALLEHLLYIARKRREAGETEWLEFKTNISESHSSITYEGVGKYISGISKVACLKDKAYGYYQKARKSGTTFDEVKQGIYAYMQYIQANGIDMQYVKMGSTFFSQKAWRDDWSARKKSLNPFMDMLREGDF